MLQMSQLIMMSPEHGSLGMESRAFTPGGLLGPCPNTAIQKEAVNSQHRETPAMLASEVESYP